METLEAIMTRHSVRRFSEKAVQQELVDKILAAAMAAPSARNQQPWHFVVIDKKDILERLSTMSKYSSMIKDAPVAIVVCADRNVESTEAYCVADCSTAGQNILLAAHSIGLGGVWVGVYPRQERIELIKKVLQLPASILPLCIIPIGYPAEKKENEDRYRAERVHYEKW